MWKFIIGLVDIDKVLTYVLSLAQKKNPDLYKRILQDAILAEPVVEKSVYEVDGISYLLITRKDTLQHITFELEPGVKAQTQSL